MDFIKFLLVKGADPNFKCKDGNTPVHIAFKAKNFDIILLLIDFGGDLNTLNNYL